MASTTSARSAAIDNGATPLGVPLGTEITTLAGMMPVEYLVPGDRIVTRRGAMVLRSIEVRAVGDIAGVAIAPGTLGHGRPGEGMVLPAGQPILLRDWRAKAMYGAAQAMVPVARLVDGVYLRDTVIRDGRLFVLRFDADEVIYADGVEVGCPTECVPA